MKRKKEKVLKTISNREKKTKKLGRRGKRLHKYEDMSGCLEHGKTQ